MLIAATGMGFASYSAAHIFPTVGINTSEWRWLGDREGGSQPDGGSFHTARNYAKLFYFLLKGRWEQTNGTVAQLLDPAWLAAAAQPTPSDWGPCPIYSHFMWRKDLNHQNPNPNKRVPADTYYAYGGGGQFAVVVPSLDLVVVSLYGGKPAVFHPPADVAEYKGHEYFPTAQDKLISDTDCDGGMGAPGRPANGCWNISFTTHEPEERPPPRGGGGGADVGSPKPKAGMPSCSCTPSDDAENDLLAGMMQRVVAAVLD